MKIEIDHIHTHTATASGRKEGFCYEVGSTGQTSAPSDGPKIEMRVYKNNYAPTSPSNAFVADSSAPQAPSIADAAPAPAVNSGPLPGSQKSMTTEPVPEAATPPAKPSVPEQIAVEEAATPAVVEEAPRSPSVVESPKASEDIPSRSLGEPEPSVPDELPNAGVESTEVADVPKEPATPTTTVPDQPASGGADLLELGEENN